MTLGTLFFEIINAFDIYLSAYIQLVFLQYTFQTFPKPPFPTTH